MIMFAVVMVGCGATTSSVVPSPPLPELTAAAVEGEPLAIGSRAPDFTATSQNGRPIRLTELNGRQVVLFFYSVDEAPGPTTIAQDFRDKWTELAPKGVVVIGISTDSTAANAAFARDHNLPFHLVSDPQGAIARAYGVDDKTGFFDNDTIVVGTDGYVKKIARSVNPNNAVSNVLTAL